MNREDFWLYRGKMFSSPEAATTAAREIDDARPNIVQGGRVVPEKEGRGSDLTGGETP